MSSEPVSPSEPIRWASRVNCQLIRRLYLKDASGIFDEELLEEVAYALWERCETIRRVTHRLCPHCAGELAGAFDDSAGRDRTITCTNCGWTSTWTAYHISYKRRRIHGGRAFAAFTQYLADFDASRLPRQRMLLIDRLIHSVHEGLEGVWTVPAACNLLEGTREEVTRFLNDLGGVTRGDEAMRSRRDEFLAKLSASTSATRDFFERRGNPQPAEAYHVLPSNKDGD